MQITMASKADIDQILKLQAQIYRVEKQTEGAEKSLEDQMADETCNIIVAKENGKVIGTATLYYINVAVRSRPYALVEGLVVDENHRSKGFGTSLFDKCVEIARAKNCYKIIFTSGTDRTNAHKFYESHGFKKWGLEFRMDLK